jgi:hypothetical protein
MGILEVVKRALFGNSAPDRRSYYYRRIIQELEEYLRRLKPRVPHSPVPHLSQEEAQLLQQINLGFSPEFWERYHELVARLRNETLTPDEQTELIAMSDQIEEANVRRMEHVAELARLRKKSLVAVMEELGISAPTYG